MERKCIRRSIYISEDTMKKLEKTAIMQGVKTSELIREFIEKGLSVESYKQDINFIASIIRQELMAIYNVDDIKTIVEAQTNRIAKMHMKSGKIQSAGFFLLVKVLMNFLKEGTTKEFEQMLNNAVGLGVDYMQKKDFQINDFLYDTENIVNLANKL